jgi:hypothetical protein
MSVYVLVEHLPYGDGDNILGVFAEPQAALKAGGGDPSEWREYPGTSQHEGRSWDRRISKKGGAASIHSVSVQEWEIRS